ncbi:cytoplasmic tyrosine-protein kinase BMX, partial [Biomphalaria glabrata]
PGVAEINKLFQDDLIEPYYYYSSSPPPVSNEPGVYLREDLSRRTLIADINPLIKKYSVLLKDQEMMLVELQAEKRKIAEAFRGAIQNIFELNRFKPENFIKFYGTVWEKRLCVLMELAPNGDLLTYICQHPQRVAQKVDIMYQIVNILSILEGKKIYHGNIRSRKFMVFAKSSLEVTIKLSDSGISQYLDSHPLENPENIDRVPWLSPERKKSLSTITYESECYSVGTTLCEMIYRNDQFHIELKLPTTLDLKCFLENSSIPKPAFIMTRENELNLLDIAEDSLVPEARKILEDIWDQVISKCWSSHPADRPTSRILLQTLNELKSRSVEIQGDTNVEAIKQIVYDVCQEDLQSRSVTSQLTMDDLQRTLMAKYPHRFLHSDNIRLTRKKIGQGHFGSVWGASICRPSLNLHQTKSDWFQVAAKMFKKGDRISEASFVREIALACELDHPKIVKMLYFAINPYIIKEEQFSYSKIMLIMEYMNMNSLIKYVSRKDITLVPAILLKICIDIAEGMVYLSGRDIVHRDLAARNVLLHQSGDCIVAKVSDFGLARNMEENYRFYNTKPDEQMPFPWMPPEILDDEAERKPFSSKGDVWSFGITMWEVFSRGKHPSVKMPEPQNVMNWYRQKNRLPRENFVCENLYDIMMKCWRLETKDRPAFVELQQELSSLRGQKITPWG